ncbi:MAG: hypothetical protein ACK4UP_05460 [Spirosomataceae bacterium]
MSTVENLKDVFLTVVYALIIAVVAPFVFWYFIMDDLKAILMDEFSRLYELRWFRNLLFVLLFYTMLAMIYLFIHFYYR